MRLNIYRYFNDLFIFFFSVCDRLPAADNPVAVLLRLQHDAAEHFGASGAPLRHLQAPHRALARLNLLLFILFTDYCITGRANPISCAVGLR